MQLQSLHRGAMYGALRQVHSRLVSSRPASERFLLPSSPILHRINRPANIGATAMTALAVPIGVVHSVLSFLAQVRRARPARRSGTPSSCSFRPDDSLRCAIPANPHPRLSQTPAPRSASPRRRAAAAAAGGAAGARRGRGASRATSGRFRPRRRTTASTRAPARSAPSSAAGRPPSLRRRMTSIQAWIKRGRAGGVGNSERAHAASAVSLCAWSSEREGMIWGRD